jgi:hypothetical protein
MWFILIGLAVIAYDWRIFFKVVNVQILFDLEPTKVYFSSSSSKDILRSVTDITNKIGVTEDNIKIANVNSTQKEKLWEGQCSVIFLLIKWIRWYQNFQSSCWI